MKDVHPDVGCEGRDPLVRTSAKSSHFTRFTTVRHSALDTISLALTVQVLYEYVVTDFGQPMLLLNVPR